MYFAVVEKQNSGFIDGWTTRYIALDTSRRYLYYSEVVKNPISLAPAEKYREGFRFEPKRALHRTSVSTSTTPTVTTTATPAAPTSTNATTAPAHVTFSAPNEGSPVLVSLSAEDAQLPSSQTQGGPERGSARSEGEVPWDLTDAPPHVVATCTFDGEPSHSPVDGRVVSMSGEAHDVVTPLGVCGTNVGALTPHTNEASGRRGAPTASGTSSGKGEGKDHTEKEKEEGGGWRRGCGMATTSPRAMHKGSIMATTPTGGKKNIKKKPLITPGLEACGSESSPPSLSDLDRSPAARSPSSEVQGNKKSVTRLGRTARQSTEGGGVEVSSLRRATESVPRRTTTTNAFASPPPSSCVSLSPSGGATSSRRINPHPTSQRATSFPPLAQSAPGNLSLHSLGQGILGGPIGRRSSTKVYKSPRSQKEKEEAGKGSLARRRAEGVEGNGDLAASEALPTTEDRSGTSRCSPGTFSHSGSSFSTAAATTSTMAAGSSPAPPGYGSVTPPVEGLQKEHRNGPLAAVEEAAAARPSLAHSIPSLPFASSSTSSSALAVPPEGGGGAAQGRSDAASPQEHRATSHPGLTPINTAIPSNIMNETPTVTPIATAQTPTHFTFSPGPRVGGGAGGVAGSSSSAVVTPPTSPSSPCIQSAIQGVKWKGKIKISCLFISSRQRTIVSPSQLYLLDISGVVREMALGEAPCDYLLCPSAALDHKPDLSPSRRHLLLKDPYRQLELYDSLRDQCLDRKRQRELAIARRKREEGSNYKPSEDEKAPPYGTIRSPVKKSDFLGFGAEKSLTFRFSCEYHYVRFLFVLTSVMGYDGKWPRPYRGFPPLDPRNQVSFAPLPTPHAYNLGKVEARYPYVYCFGNFLGRDLDGKLQISIKNCFMCITNDMVMPVRLAGTIPTWLRQCHIQECYYNTTATRPYIALISDAGEPDFIFSPSLPEMGTFLPDFQLSPNSQVQRLQYILYQCCFASVQARRVIVFKEAKENTIRSFIERVEAERGQPLELRYRLPSSAGQTICPEDHVNLREVWYSVGATNAEMDHNVVENSAVPLYDTNPNNAPISIEQLQLMRSLVEQERLEDELVGLALESVTSLSPAVAGGTSMGIVPGSFSRATVEEGGRGGGGLSSLAEGRSSTGRRARERSPSMEMRAGGGWGVPGTSPPAALGASWCPVPLQPQSARDTTATAAEATGLTPLSNPGNGSGGGGREGGGGGRGRTTRTGSIGGFAASVSLPLRAAPGRSLAASVPDDLEFMFSSSSSKSRFRRRRQHWMGTRTTNGPREGLRLQSSFGGIGEEGAGLPSLPPFAQSVGPTVSSLHRTRGVFSTAASSTTHVPIASIVRSRNDDPSAGNLVWSSQESEAGELRTAGGGRGFHAEDNGRRYSRGRSGPLRRGPEELAQDPNVLQLATSLLDHQAQEGEEVGQMQLEEGEDAAERYNEEDDVASFMESSEDVLYEDSDDEEDEENDEEERGVRYVYRQPGACYLPRSVVENTSTTELPSSKEDPSHHRSPGATRNHPPPATAPLLGDGLPSSTFSSSTFSSSLPHIGGGESCGDHSSSSSTPPKMKNVKRKACRTISPSALASDQIQETTAATKTTTHRMAATPNFRGRKSTNTTAYTRRGSLST